MKYSEKIGIIMAIVMIIGFIARMIMGVCILLGAIKWKKKIINYT